MNRSRIVSSWPAVLLVHLSAAAVFAASITVAPVNDDFDYATSITALPFEDSTDMSESTRAADDPFCLLDAPTAWYAFIPTDDMTIEITTPSSTVPPSIGVYTGARGALTPLACASLQPITLTVESGLTYYIMLSGSGQVGLSVAALSPPANDDIGHALPIVVLPFSSEFDTRAATTAPDDPDCFGQGATVWYRLFLPTVPVPFGVTLSTVGSDYQATVSVYAGSPGALTPVACGLSQVTFTGRGYESYYLMVGSASGGAGGRLALSVTAIGALYIDLSVNSTVQLMPQTSLATITGRLFCTRPVVVRLDGMLWQTSPGTTGRFVRDVSCTDLTSWSISVGPFEAGRFLRGSAELRILATASDPESGETAKDQFSGTVTLRVRRIIDR